jgi:predicted nuclease with RNAse H fold
MPRILVAAAALCFAVSAAGVPFAAKAEPELLTAAQLDSISAGRALWNVRLPVIARHLESVDLGIGNVNIAAQMALATATATAVCFFCAGDVIATAVATAGNFNLATQQVTQQ